MSKATHAPAAATGMPTILVIDDEVQIRRLLHLALEAHGYTVHEAGCGLEGLEEILLRRPHVIILDMGLPDIDGLQVLKRLREWSDIPVLILTIRDDEKLKVASLEAGADDYVTKPFSTAELLARLRVIQRRQHSSGAPEVALGALRIDFTTQRVSLHGREVKLTPTEYQLLKSLAFYPGRVITQAQLIRNLWGGSIAHADAALRVHINHLRKKLCAGTSGLEIRNEAALGYRLLASEAPGLNS